MGTKILSVSLLVIALLASPLLFRYIKAEEPHYLLGNMEFHPRTCSEGKVLTYKLAMTRFECIAPSSRYALFVQSTQYPPGDADTMYFGMLSVDPTPTAGRNKIYIRYTGTIKAAEIYCYAVTTTGTAEEWQLYIRKNGTTDTLVASVSLAAKERIFSNTSLSISIVSGDYIEMKSVQPKWLMNPVGVLWAGNLFIE